MISKKTKKFTAFALSAVMLIGTALPAFAVDTGDAQQDQAFEKISKNYSLISYESYKTKFEYSTDSRTGESVTVKGSDYLKEQTDAGVEETEWQGEDAVIVDDKGSISWSLDVPETGWYCVKFRYCAANERAMDMERILFINGKSPYVEARYQNFNKVWGFDYVGDTGERIGAFEEDSRGNELRPETVIIYEWRDHIVRDKDGLYNIPLEFYLEKGTNVITLEGIREPIAISEVSIYTYEELPTYADVLAEYERKGYEPADTDGITFEAEMPDKVSSHTIYPIYDRSSAITSPQDKSKVYRNIMGGDKWMSAGQWISYKFECEATGLYQIAVRYNQDQIRGMYTSRSIKINGEYPFEEAVGCQFPYDNKWQSKALGDDNNEFQFYFEEGKTYEIELAVSLGDFADVVRQVSQVVDSLNNDYMRIVELTGTDPDEYRDYGFVRIMPDVVRDLSLQSSILFQLVDYISEMNGIKSDNTSTLEQAAVVAEKMASDEKEIAVNFNSLKNWVSSLGTWISDMKKQFLEMDTITIQPAGSEIPRGEASGWKSFVFELQKFVASFYTDYSDFGEQDSDQKSIEVWTTSGRDQAQIIRNLTENGYTLDTGINVNVQLTGQGALLPSIMAGVGPDVSLDATSPTDMAIRGAILPLNDYDTFDEVMARFADSAKEPVSLYGKTYAIPTSQVFPVMFTRDDILAELGMSVPETWDDLMSMIPVLQFNNMDIGMIGDFRHIVYQMGGEYYADEGMRTNFDDYVTLDAFEYTTNMFTQYSLPVQISAENRFKTGEIPLFIQEYSFYNTLVVFAPEISGLWSFHEIPGIRDEETGEVKHTTLSGVTGVLITRGCKDDEAAWRFIDWYSDKDFQVDYSNEMMALLGPSAKQTVANIEALEELPWSDQEIKTLKTCFEHTASTPIYPGDYYMIRYMNFAHNAVLSKGVDASDQMLSYVDTINKEITRKRREFEFMVDEEWQAIKDYMEFETVNDWKEYWADEQGVDIDRDSTYIQDNQEGADEYTYVDWMEEHNVTVNNHEEWIRAVKYDGETATYKEWLED